MGLVDKDRAPAAMSGMGVWATGVLCPEGDEDLEYGVGDKLESVDSEMMCCLQPSTGTPAVSLGEIQIFLIIPR